MAQDFLEIVVPTYNRSPILAFTIRELIAAAQLCPGDVSLRVIDNCSTDDTFLVANFYACKGLLAYEKNDANIGLIKNIAKCIHSSRAQWVWVFGDDDHILPHALPPLINALRQLPPDVVFARALSVKVTDNGYISHVESKGDKANSFVFHDPGISITSNGSIHSLAFISQLLINPSHWNQEYHDSIYSDTDLYTFVLTLLHECQYNKSADLHIHVVAATDRGDRSYYTPNMCVARLTEYTAYEHMVHAALGRGKARKILEAGRKKLLILRAFSCIKLIGNNKLYKINGEDPIAYLSHYKSPYWLDTVVVRSFAFLARAPAIRTAFRYAYRYCYDRLVNL